MSGLFISYRRSDSAPWAGRLRDRLAADLGEDGVFFDIDNIDLGQDFRNVIAATLESCDVVLVLIGPTWLARDANGRRRIDDPADLHRIEVATALRSASVVIPLLVGGATMPSVEDLPTEVQDLAFRNALTVDHDSFGRDVEVLERALERMRERAAQPVEPPTRPVGLPATHDTAVGERAGGDNVGAPVAVSRTVPALPRRSRAPWVVLSAVAAVVLLVAIVVAVLAAGSGGNGDGGKSPASPTRTSAPGEGSSSTSKAVALPARAAVYDRPLDQAEKALVAVGLVVRRDTVGCSESTEPGFVRQVTAGRALNERIIYGKSTDVIDTAAAASLHVGDEVTLWSPLRKPC